MVRNEVDRVCLGCGRDPSEVLLVAVSKTVGIPEVLPALDGGACDFGENRPDELVAKQAAYPHARWHFIGNVQSRRIKDVVGTACLIHSVFKCDHLPKIEHAAAEAGIVQDILLEVNSGEENKGGIAPEQAGEFIEMACRMEHVHLRGLMTMAPQGDLVQAEECFADMCALRASLNQRFSATLRSPLTELSMGMSEDWQQAVRQGSTMVRIGRAVFSEDFA